MDAVISTVTQRDLEAADWCISLAEGELDVADRADFDLWIADDTNVAALEYAARVWRAAGQSAELPDVLRLRAEAITRLRTAQRRRGRRPLSFGWASGAAAAIAAALVLAVLLLQPPVKVYRTDIGERHVVMLADGSRLSLDADTEVHVGLSRDRRDLFLTRGRAKFDVARDPMRPFAVAMDGKVVVATGTSFSVELVDREARVLLYEGHVAVMDHPAGPGGASSDRSAMAGAFRALRPGSELVVLLDEALGHARVLDFDPAQSLGWEAGRMNFEDEPLALAVERMNRYSTREIVLTDPVLTDLTVNGVFAADDVGTFLEAVTAFHGVEVIERDGVVMLRPT